MRHCGRTVTADVQAEKHLIVKYISFTLFSWKFKSLPTNWVNLFAALKVCGFISINRKRRSYKSAAASVCCGGGVGVCLNLQRKPSAARYPHRGDAPAGLNPPWSQYRPPQPSLQSHCQGSLQVPCLQPGCRTHSSQLLPCQPCWHTHSWGDLQKPCCSLHPAQMADGRRRDAGRERAGGGRSKNARKRGKGGNIIMTVCETKQLLTRLRDSSLNSHTVTITWLHHVNFL